MKRHSANTGCNHIIFLLAGLLAAPALNAELVAYEGFDYDPAGIFGPADIKGKSGGVGWTGEWVDINRRFSPGATAPLEEGSLTYVDAAGNALETTGNKVHLDGSDEFGAQPTWLGRDFTEVPSNDPGSVLFISVIAQRVGQKTDPTAYPNEEKGFNYPYPFKDNLYPGPATLSTINHTNPFEPASWEVRIGNVSEETDTWKMQGKDVGKNRFGAPDTEVSFSAEPAFAVLKIEYFETEGEVEGAPATVVGTRLSLYMNPLLESMESNVPDVEAVMTDDGDPYQTFIEGISIGVVANSQWFNSENQLGDIPAGEMLVDEIRVGTSWEAVTPVGTGEPEPLPVELAETFFDLPSGSAADGWLNAAGFGWFWGGTYPWMSLVSDGSWLFSYSLEGSFTQGGWFYSPSEGFVFFTNAVFYPWIYRSDTGSWENPSN